MISKSLVSLLLFLFSFFLSKAQHIENLIFEGAGMRGLAYGGVVEVLEQNNLLADLKKVGGTSAGAITSLLISLGYQSNEIITIISSTNFRKFNDGSFFFIGGIARMKNRYGWYRGERFSKWLYNIIETKTGNGDITFGELKAQNYPALYCVTTSLTSQKIVVLSAENYPDMRVKDAVRASMSIPLYFGAVFIDENGKVYKKPNKSNSLEILIDGGITGNYPIGIFDEENSNFDRIPNSKTLGFRIDSDLQTQKDQETRELVNQNIESLTDFVSALYIYTIENLNRNLLEDYDWERTVSLSSVGIGPKIKKLSDEDKLRLIESGRRYTNQYLVTKGLIN